MTQDDERIGRGDATVAARHRRDTLINRRLAFFSGLTEAEYYHFVETGIWPVRNETQPKRIREGSVY